MKNKNTTAGSFCFEWELEIEYDYTAGQKGVLTLSNGDPGYPDEPEQLTIYSVKRNGFEIIDFLSADDMKSIEEGVIEEIKYKQADKY